MPARVIVTCGPSYEPVDEVRRLTNHSTGELGILLANRLAADGWAVTCLIGEGATSPEPLAPGVARLPFTTNDSLQQQLAALPERKNVAALFQAAALCDFRVKRASAEHGRAVSNAKISSRTGVITLELEPDGKVIGTLRGLFPRSRLVGWKYELDGTREDVVAKGQRQMSENRTDVCVLNGRAWGSGFGVLSAEGELVGIPDRPALCDWLAQWLRGVSPLAL